MTHEERNGRKVRGRPWVCPHCNCMNGNANWKCFMCGQMPVESDKDEDE
jgi:hypothetical protein